MRMLLVTREDYPTFRVDLTELFSHQLAGLGWTIDWYMRAQTPQPQTVLNISEAERVYLGGRAARGSTIGRVSDLWCRVRHDLRLVCLVRRGGYEFVQVRDRPMAGLLAAFAARSARIPFFYWMSFPYPEADTFRASDPEHPLRRSRRWFYRLRGAVTGWLLYRHVLPRAAHVFVQSDRMLEDVSRHGIPRARMTPVAMCIDVARVEAAEAADSGPADDPRLQGRIPLVYLGTMVRLRRIDILIDMLALLAHDVPDAILVLVGDAPKADMAYLRQRARELDVSERVVFTGFVPMETAWSYLRAATVCLSPFRPSPVLDSCSPTKVVEYLAWGKPVVANDHPDQTAVLQGNGCGVLVDFSAEGFARGVLSVLSNPAIGARARQAGRRWVRRHRDYATLGVALDARYRDLLTHAGNLSVATARQGG